MAVIVGERINKITAERNKGAQETQFNVVISPNIVSVRKEEANVGGEKKQGISVGFEFKAKYGEAYGTIVIEGDIFIADKPEVLQKLADDWTNQQKILDEDIRIGVMNRMLEVSYLHAIQMSGQVKLPPPLQMPKFKKAEDSTQSKESVTPQGVA